MCGQWGLLWLLVVCGAGVGRELDPARCAARFEVQRDKIIRTEESRAMGARYLAELDVGSRAECRRLCCETDACDVFVLEENSPGSCYLFACGPPEDFRCKFTHHGNFSSGVMALSRRLAELQDMEPQPTRLFTTTTTNGSPHIFSHTGGLQTGDEVTRRRPHVVPPPPPYAYGEDVASGPVDGSWGGWRWGGRWGPPPPGPPPAGAAKSPLWGPPPPASGELAPPAAMAELPSHDAAKKGPRPEPEAPVAVTTTPPTTTTTPAPPPSPPLQHEDTTPRNIHEKLRAQTAASSQAVEEGAAATPASASLLLVLGVGLTVAACAMASRGVRRRRRRGARQPHDADYLVNGMYL